MRVLDRKGQRRIAMVGLGVLAVSLFGGIESASAVGPSRTTLSTSTASVPLGEIAKLKAVVKPVTGTLLPTGTVTFREGTTVVGSPVPLELVNTVQTAKIEMTTLAVGSHSFTATYNGSTDFTASTSLVVTIVVTAATKGATTSTATTPTPAPGPGEEVKLKAVVKQVTGTIKPTGSVTFSEGGTALAVEPLALAGTVMTAKHTLLSLPLGTHVITATYSGSTTFNASSGVIQTITVGKANTTCTLVATAVTATPGKTALVVTVAPVAPATGIPTGTVSYSVDSGAGQVFPLTSTGKKQFNVVYTVGTAHTARVTYAGDAKYNGCTSALVNFTS